MRRLAALSLAILAGMAVVYASRFWVVPLWSGGLFGIDGIRRLAATPKGPMIAPASTSLEVEYDVVATTVVVSGPVVTVVEESHDHLHQSNPLLLHFSGVSTVQSFPSQCIEYLEAVG